MNIIALLKPLSPYITSTTLRQLSILIGAMLAMTGRVTMLGMARWTDKGGSYRSVQRFFQTVIPWAQILWAFFWGHLHQEEDEYVLAGDESIVNKSGQKTYGLGRYYSSLWGRTVSSVALFALSLVNTRERRSYPVLVEQVLCGRAEKAPTSKRLRHKKSAHLPGRPGRPPGRRNGNKTEVTLTPELLHIQTMVKQFLAVVDQRIKLTYLVLDGHFGNNNALQMVRQCGLHLVSKLRHDAALYFLYEGETKRRKYGDRVDYAHIPSCYLQQTKLAEGLRTDIYQVTVRHKAFAEPLNVVVVLKTKSSTGSRARVLLFSSDLTLSWAQLLDYYELRFQIEFNFRDAKQYWGLEDFMNVSKTPVTNAINLSFLMVNVAHALLQEMRRDDPLVSVLDLKAHCRGHRYVAEMLKLLPQKPDPVFTEAILSRISRLGRVHPPHPSLFPS